MIRIRKCQCGTMFMVITKLRVYSCPVCRAIYPFSVCERIRQAYNAVDHRDTERSKEILAELRSEYGEDTHVIETEAARIEALIRRLDEDHKPNLSGDTVEVWISKNGRIYFGAGTEDLDSIICRHIRDAIECHWINDHKGE